MNGHSRKRSKLDGSVSLQYEPIATPIHDNSMLENPGPSTFHTMNAVISQTFQVPLAEQSSSESSQNILVTVLQSPQTIVANDEISMICDEPMTPETPKTTISQNSTNKSQDANGSATKEFSFPMTPNRRGGAAKGKGRKGLRRQSLTRTDQDDEEGLYNDLLKDSPSLIEMADSWINQYKLDKEKAVLALMQFFISSSGCKGRLTSEMQSTMEIDAIIRRMTEEFNEDSAVYPLVAAGQQKKFREIYGKFLNTLIVRCQYSIIYDRFMMDRIISLLTALSDSQVRAFRHTATFATMKVMTALVNVALTVSTNLRNARRQWEAERRKSHENRATDRIASLTVTCNQFAENIEEIKEMLEYMFKSVFVHRYSDVVSDIRAICVAEIGIWMLKFHEFFLDDSYLKYIGWLLNDKVGEVRLKSLEALQPLYASKNFTAKLDLFTRKFKDRIVEMTLDKEPEVAVQAVKLVTYILKNHREIMNDKNCEDIYELVYSSHRDIAHAAGEFLNERLFKADPETFTQTMTKRGKQRLPNTSMIRDLIMFFIESEVHKHAAYLVDSLIESNKMMKDWECMTDLLLEEAGPYEEILNNQQETSLIEIMACCVKQAATGEPPVLREPARKIVTAKKQRQIYEDKQKITEHFIQTLPLLLEKYRADPDKVGNLLVVPQYFDLEMYTSMRQEQSLDRLLKIMYDIVDKMYDADVLTTAAKTLEFLCINGQGISQQCETARSILLDNIVDKYKQANDRYTSLMDTAQTPNEDEIFNVVYSLKKVFVYYSLHDMNHYEIWDSLYKNFEDTRFFTQRLPDEALVYCMKACYFLIIWSQNSLLNTEPSIHREANENLLMERLQSFMESMMYFVGDDENRSGVSTPAILRKEAYISICDLLVAFNNRTTTEASNEATKITYQPDERMQTMLNRFVQENVFSGRTEFEGDVEQFHKIDLIHERRTFLAAYCKVVTYTTVSMSAIADVFKHYLRYYNDYGDIIKLTIGKARDKDRVHCARTMQLSLKTLYISMVEKYGEVKKFSQEFIAIKDLAKRFALLFGFDVAKNSPALLALHSDGVLFAITPPDGVDRDPANPPVNLPYLDILAELSYKLGDKDKRAILNFIDTELEAELASSRGEEWMPLLHYRSSLMHGMSLDQTPNKRRVYPRRKKNQIAGEENTDDEAVQELAGKPKKKPAAKGTPLKVIKSMRLRTPKISESSDTTSVSVSPMPVIEGSSQSLYDGSEDGLKSLQINTPTYSTRDPFQEPME